MWEYDLMMTVSKILLVEDDDAGRELGAYNLRKAGYKVTDVASGEAALSVFEPRSFHLVITDVKMPGITGMELLSRIKDLDPAVPVLVITAYGNMEMAVTAMRAGAYDFIGKPFNREHLLITVRRALDTSHMAREIADLRRKATGVEREIVHRSEIMARVIALADKVATTEATVLVTGESGTGKELIARRVHAMSDRGQGPFLAVNLAAMSSGLLESELFGHVKGAFTGADFDRPGRFRQAHGGSLFLDEVSELPIHLQSKLLRVLQERSVDVVGSDVPVEVDVRIIAATNRNLQEELRHGRLREDLYYRLGAFQIDVPPLRARPEDIEPLVRHFVDAHSTGADLSIPDTVVEGLTRRPWPGNVRQLENACQRMAILATEGRIRLEDLPPASPLEGPGRPDATGHVLWPSLPADGLSLVDVERSLILRVLEHKGWNVSQAANYLKVPRHILAYRMEKYGISRDGN